MATNREIATKIAWSFLGKPYIWGGDDPVAGFDCSGFVIEVLKSVGILPHRGDWTAARLEVMFGDAAVTEPREGCLAFWGTRLHVAHVEYCLNARFSIGASGGTSATDSKEDAINQNAYIKVRPIRGRGKVWFVDPFRA